MWDVAEWARTALVCRIFQPTAASALAGPSACPSLRRHSQSGQDDKPHGGFMHTLQGVLGGL